MPAIETMANHGQRDVYLPICGPWGVYCDEDPERLAWSLACAIDYLGYRVAAGDQWRDRLVLRLETGTYHVRTQVYGDCTLGLPHRYSPREINYGEFEACTVHQEAVSPAVDVE